MSNKYIDVNQKKKKGNPFDIILSAVNVIVIFLLSNYPALSHYGLGSILCILLIAYYLFLNFIPSLECRSLQTKKLKSCGNGCRLLELFLASTTLTALYTIIGWFGAYSRLGTLLASPKLWLANLLVSVLIEAFVFWNGIIHVYVSSSQLGIRYRVIGIICGWIPIANLAALHVILHTVKNEVSVENEKLICNLNRKEEQVCKTKYPLLLVHGVFFRDFRYFNYWGRIPAELEKNGATIYYGCQQSAASVEACGKELAARIEEIVKTTGCEKVNIIAHSKGGLDSRYAISLGGVSQYVASLTTINTPHRGCEFADYLLHKIPEKQKQLVASTYNTALKKAGDTHPDFLEAVYDLTSENCTKRNELVKDVDGVYYQSVGSKLNHAQSGRFPLNFSYYLVNYFDGANDGLVGDQSYPWGSKSQFLTVNGKRGISHGDMIDLNRENIKDFDVREFYVELVKNLKDMGY